MSGADVTATPKSEGPIRVKAIASLMRNPDAPVCADANTWAKRIVKIGGELGPDYLDRLRIELRDL